MRANSNIVIKTRGFTRKNEIIACIFSSIQKKRLKNEPILSQI